MWLNFPDFQLGMIDASKNAQRLLTVRYFSTTANYAVGDYVVQSGQLYQAKAAVTAGAFSAAQWDKVIDAADLTTVTAAYLPLVGGTLTGPLVLAADPAAPLQASTKSYVDGKVAAYLLLAGGTLTGPLVLAADPAAPLQASTKNYVDSKVAAVGSGVYLPLTGGTVTGATEFQSGIVVDGASSIVPINIFAGAGTGDIWFRRSLGAPRWLMRATDTPAGETGSDVGSNFSLYRYHDNGTLIDAPFSINRATSQVKFNIPAGATTASYPHIDAPVALNAMLVGSKGGVDRWSVSLGNNVAESGSNNGSNFAVNRYSDAGAYIDTPLSIYRSNGSVVFAGPSMNINSTTGVTVSLNKAASGQENIVYGATNGSSRWSMSLGNATAETGSNVGSDYALNTFTDANAYLNTPLQIKRSNNVATFAVAIVNGPSDRTLKENIEPITGALDKVLALDGVRFNFIGATEEKRLGLIAQDVQPICPEVIQPYQTQDTEGRAAETKLAIDYPQLVAVLIEAVKALTTRVEQLEAGA
jgi:hypothetical protein